MIKKDDFVYCIRDYDDFFNIGKEYPMQMSVIFQLQ